MWESKAWIVLERLISLVGLLVLMFGIWYSLIRIEAKQAQNNKQVNATLEAIKQRMGNDKQWQNAKNLLNDNLPK